MVKYDQGELNKTDNYDLCIRDSKYYIIIRWNRFSKFVGIVFEIILILNSKLESKYTCSVIKKQLHS